MSEDAKRKIEEMVTAIGALGEFLGESRESFMRNGFTREEALYLCAELLKASTKPNGGTNHESEL